MIVFKRQSPNKTPSFKSKDKMQLYKAIAPKQLLALQRRQGLIRPLFGYLGLEANQYELKAFPLLLNLAAYLQELPETRNSYFSNRGGFLDHSLSRCEAALTMARDYFVDEQGQTVKELSKEQQLWMYALYSGALLRGIGKLISDFLLETYDAKGEYLKRHLPLESNLYQQCAYYDYTFDVAFPDTFKRRATLLIATKVMPQEGLTWLNSNKEVLASWLSMLDEDDRGAGTLGLILDKADCLVISRYFNERVLAQYGEGEPKVSRNSSFLSPERDGTAAKDGELPQAGMEFIRWLNKALASGKLMMNQAPLFIVPGGMLMNADIFKLFVRESPLFKNWQNVQKALVQLKLHEIGPNGAITQKFLQTKNNQLHSGMVLSAMGVVLPEKVKLMAASGVAQTVSAQDLLSGKQGEGFKSLSGSGPTMQAITSNGKWTSLTTSPLGPGPNQTKF